MLSSEQRLIRSRKTNDGIEGSTQKSQRVSRIAQPIRGRSTRTDSLDRTPSMDTLQVPSSTNAKRLKSCSATPLRTPNRPSCNNANLLTCERKKEMQLQVEKINDYLHIMEPILGKDFFVRGGLKTMSTKQFVSIINHFLKKISGNRLSVGANYVDGIAKVLSQLKYPYPVNKSWLKTPTAPHSFNHVLTLVGWLLTFILTENNIIEFEENIVPGEEFPDKDFAGKFMRRAEVGFILWNNAKEDELETLKRELVDEIIFKKTGVRDVLSVDDEIVNINKAINEIEQNKVEIKEEEFFKLDKEVKFSKAEASRLEGDYKQNLEQLMQLQSTYENKKSLVNESEVRIAKIKDEIDKQESSTKDRNDLISQLSSLRQSLETERKFVCEMQDMDAANQVQLSRLIKQEIDTVSKCNKYLYDIFKNEVFLDPNRENQLESQLDRIVSLLETEKATNREDCVKYMDKFDELSRQLKVATHKHDAILETQLVKVSQNCNELEKKIEEIDKKFVNCEGSAYQQSETLTTKFNEFRELNSHTRKEISSKHKELKTLVTRNEDVLNKIVSKGKETLAEKEMQAKKMAEVIDRLKQKIDFALSLDFEKL